MPLIQTETDKILSCKPRKAQGVSMSLPGTKLLSFMICKSANTNTMSRYITNSIRNMCLHSWNISITSYYFAVLRTFQGISLWVVGSELKQSGQIQGQIIGLKTERQITSLSFYPFPLLCPFHGFIKLHICQLHFVFDWVCLLMLRKIAFYFSESLVCWKNIGISSLWFRSALELKWTST